MVKIAYSCVNYLQFKKEYFVVNIGDNDSKNLSHYDVGDHM